MDDFFIGWQEKSPRSFSRMIRRFVVALCLVVPAVALLVTAGQRGFSDAVFEFGNITELEGILSMQPVPRLCLDSGASLLLVGSGKHGAQAAVRSLENQSGIALDGKRIRIKGFLLYHDGRGVLELPENGGLLPANDKGFLPAQPSEELGTVTLSGEIADPKCFFGAMKPGEGKPHRSCAVRCIAGGIPPVFKVQSADGSAEYFLLRGPDGSDIHESLLPFVADGVRITGQLERRGDWYVLKTDPATGICRVRPYWFGEDEPMCGNSLK